VPVREVIVIGGGAAGFFAAIHCAELMGSAGRVRILEKGPDLLTKVRISGGGRCNVTHACESARELVGYYPRGHKNLMGTFSRWGTQHTVDWFAQRGVELKTEADGRMFPITDSSHTIIETLMSAAEEAGVFWQTRCGVDFIEHRGDGKFTVLTTEGDMTADAILVATGGVRSRDAMRPTESLGQIYESAVPSLFTFKLNDPRLNGLQGLSVENVKVKTGKLEASGPLLVTHWGVSGPGILKLSAWGARELAEVEYRFTLQVNWLPHMNEQQLKDAFLKTRTDHGKRRIVNERPFLEIPKRLWVSLCKAAEISEETQWSGMSKTHITTLIRELLIGQYQVEGKSLNKDEFVTCGGVPLKTVNLKTMESKDIPGIYYAGEVLDVDGVTGGYNFQAAWATGRIAAEAIANRP